MRNEKGFSLVELLITMAVFVLVLVAASQIFAALLMQFKQQSKIGETDIEGAVGLEIMRYDLANAGYGLPWSVSGAGWSAITNYCEACSNAALSPNPANYNDGTGDCGCTASTGGAVPRAIINQQGIGLNNSDYLVIKSANVVTNFAAGKSTNLNSAGVPTTWAPNSRNVNVKDDGTTSSTAVRVIVLSVGANSPRQLVLNGSAWYTTYSATFSSGFAPTEARERNIVYGVDPNTNLRMPFNRADYYIKRPADIPSRCAPNTGVLYKATVSHNGGALSEMPLLDCVAYMHADYMLDTNGDGTIDARSDDISSSGSNLTADQIRNQLVEVRLYIIAQEGQMDPNYDFSNGGTRKDFRVIEVPPGGILASRTVYIPGVSAGVADLSTLIGDPAYKHYRWKLYTLVVQPNSLR